MALPRCAVCGSKAGPIRRCRTCTVSVHRGCYPAASRKAAFECDTCKEGIEAHKCDRCLVLWDKTSAKWQPVMQTEEGSWSHSVCLSAGGRRSKTFECISCMNSQGILLKCSTKGCPRRCHPSCALVEESLQKQQSGFQYLCQDHGPPSRRLSMRDDSSMVIEASAPPSPVSAIDDCSVAIVNGKTARLAKRRARASITAGCLEERIALPMVISDECCSSAGEYENDDPMSQDEEEFESDSVDTCITSDDEICDDDDDNGEDRLSISLHDSVQFRPAQSKGKATSAFNTEAINLLDDVSKTIDEVIANQIARSNSELFESVFEFIRAPSHSLPTAVIATGIDRSDNGLRFERLRQFLISRGYQVGLLQNSTSVVDCLWNIVGSVKVLRKTAPRPEDVLTKISSQTPLAVVIDSIECLDQTLVNNVIHRLTSITNIVLVLGVSSHAAILNEFLFAQTTRFLTIREFSIRSQHAHKALQELLLSCRLPVQFGPDVVRYLQRRFDDANQSLRVLGHQIKTGVMLFLSGKPKLKSLAKSKITRENCWKAFSIFCDLLDNTWTANEKSLSMGGLTTPLERFFSVQGFDPKRSSEGPIFQLLHCLNTCRSRPALTKTLNLWHDILFNSQMEKEAQQMQYLLDNFDNLETTQPTVVTSVKASSRVSKRLLQALPDKVSAPSVNAVSARLSQFLSDFIHEKLPHLSKLPGSTQFLFDDANALEKLSIDNIEAFLLKSLCDHPELDILKVYQYVCEAPSISVDYGSIFSKFKCMNNKKTNEVQLQARFLQAIEDLCVLGIIAHSSRPGYIDRIMSLNI